MADTLTTKKVTELTENTAMSDEDLFMVGSAGTASLRKLKWSNIWNTIKTAILGKLAANNLTTTAAGYLLDARQGKALDDKISKLNTDKSNKLMVKSWNYPSANVQNASVAVDRYTAIGVVGWYVPNTSGVFCQLYVSDNKLTMASSLTSQVSVRVYILYVKN